MEYKSLFEKYSDDVLMDNTQIPKYEQCKDCLFSESGMRGTLDYKKAYCAVCPYGESKGKPHGVYTGAEICKYHKKK